jgi:hypothetical protein
MPPAASNGHIEPALPMPVVFGSGRSRNSASIPQQQQQQRGMRLLANSPTKRKARHVTHRSSGLASGSIGHGSSETPAGNSSSSNNDHNQQQQQQQIFDLVRELQQELQAQLGGQPLGGKAVQASSGSSSCGSSSDSSSDSGGCDQGRIDLHAQSTSTQHDAGSLLGFRGGSASVAGFDVAEECLTAARTSVEIIAAGADAEDQHAGTSPDFVGLLKLVASRADVLQQQLQQQQQQALPLYNPQSSSVHASTSIKGASTAGTGAIQPIGQAAEAAADTAAAAAAAALVAAAAAATTASSSSIGTVQQLLGQPLPQSLRMLLQRAVVHESVGLSPVHVAAAAGRVDVLKGLAWAGCDMNQKLLLDDHLNVAVAKAIGAASAADGSSGHSFDRTAAAAAAMTAGPASTGTVTDSSSDSSSNSSSEPLAIKRQRRTVGDQHPLAPGAAAAAWLPMVQQQRPLWQQCTPLLPRNALAGWALQTGCCSSRGCTPLHVAACHGRDDVCAVLIQLPGVDVEAVNDQGWTALHVAAHMGHTGGGWQVLGLLCKRVTARQRLCHVTLLM